MRPVYGEPQDLSHLPSFLLEGVASGPVYVSANADGYTSAEAGGPRPGPVDCDRRLRSDPRKWIVEVPPAVEEIEMDLEFELPEEEAVP